MINIKLLIYTTGTGKQPFLDWQEELDFKTKTIIIARLSRIRAGNFGDCKSVKGAPGVWELRVDYGPGYRIYFGKTGDTLVILLSGGDKGSQNRDIAKIKRYWQAYKESHE